MFAITYMFLSFSNFSLNIFYFNKIWIYNILHDAMLISIGAKATGLLSSSPFLTIFTKVNNLCDFLFASLDSIGFQISVYS